MLIVLGLLPLQDVCMITGTVAVIVWWILVAMPLRTFLLLVYKACVLGLMCFTVVSFRPLYGLLQRTAHSHDVDEAWDEVQDLGVVGEREIVGEPRRAQHALVAQVDLGSLGKLTLTLDTTPVHR